MSDPTGTARLVAYLFEVNEEELEEIAEEFADILLKRSKDPEKVFALIAAEPWEVPESDDDLVREVGEKASFILLPNQDGRSHD